MTLAFMFRSADRLWLLVVLAALLVGYLVLHGRRQQYAVRFTNLDLLDSVAPKRPGWRRHLPAAAFLLGGLSLVVALAHPTRAERVPSERATIILAIDVSLSMQADDVKPTRLEAAQTAATSFLDEVPATVNVGLLSFSGTVSLLVSPTTDREAVRTAIAGLQLQEGTAIGSAILASLDALKQVPSAGAGSEPVPGRIVLMSDGKTTVGQPNSQGVAAAQKAQVPVTTIAFGTDQGSISVEGSPLPVPVPVNREALRDIADQTGGSFFEAFTESELANVYRNIGSSIGYKTEQRDIAAWFVGVGALMLLLAAAGSLLWTSRFP
jgi:Ca-activated chloride channel family protein